MKKQVYRTTLIAAVVSLLLINVSFASTAADAHIEESARQSFVFQRFLSNEDINFDSKDGVVTLTGTVSEETHKQLAEETVGSMAGVKSVINKLEVMGEGPVAQSDAWVMMKIKTSLLYHRSVSGIDTEVNVQDGVVTLRGNAASQEQKNLATEYANDIEGVKEVRNEMIVAKTPGEPGPVKAAVKEVKRDTTDAKTPVATVAKPAVAKMDARTESVDDASITALVKTMMMNRRSTSGLDTKVETKDAVVTLSGKVKDAAVKEMVTRYVSDIHGVKQVINNITVQ